MSKIEQCHHWYGNLTKRLLNSSQFRKQNLLRSRCHCSTLTYTTMNTHHLFAVSYNSSSTCAVKHKMGSAALLHLTITISFFFLTDGTLRRFTVLLLCYSITECPRPDLQRGHYWGQFRTVAPFLHHNILLIDYKLTVMYTRVMINFYYWLDCTLWPQWLTKLISQDLSALLSRYVFILEAEKIGRY